MAERLFPFVQMEFPWELGPQDGRYLLRGARDGEPERVVVLGTVGATRRTGRKGRRRRREADPQPAPVLVARATIIDAVPVSAESQARAWLESLDAERESRAAAAALNRMLYAQRIATADPHIHAVSPAQATLIRAGWGEGEEVANGRWRHAVELPFSEPSKRRRSAVLRPQERLASLLAARAQPLMCEELVLRARLDLDEGRLAHAALELEAAYAAAPAELRAEGREGLDGRIEELEGLREGVAAAARAALPGDRSTGGAAPAAPELQTIRHALERLEAALRARTAAGSFS